MEIHEYQAKKLFATFGIEVPEFGPAETADQALKWAQTNPSPRGYVVKAQVHAGGRGKAGGVQKAGSADEVYEKAQAMIGQKIITPQTGKEGKVVHQVMVEKMQELERELYLSLLLDRSTQSLTLITSAEGGMSIEELAQKSPEKIVKIPLDTGTGLLDFQSLMALKSFHLPFSALPQLKRLLSSLFQLMIQKSATLIEINPLAETKTKKLVPLDAKMSFDDNALFRHSDIEALRDLKEVPQEEQKALSEGLSFVKLSGNIGCLVNGAGLAMATMDIVQAGGGQPANFLDVGGGVDSQKIDAAFQILTEDPQVKGILVNIFGGIVKCDLIAEGLVKATKNINMPIVVRLEGTRAKEARALLKTTGGSLIFADTLDSAVGKIISLVQGSKMVQGSKKP